MRDQSRPWQQGASGRWSEAGATHTTLQNDNEATKLGLSKAARKAAERLSRYPGEKVIGKAKQLREIAGAASTVHGWEAKQSGVNVFGQAVVVTDEQIADLRQRLARIRGDAPAEAPGE